MFVCKCQYFGFVLSYIFTAHWRFQDSKGSIIKFKHIVPANPSSLGFLENTPSRKSYRLHRIVAKLSSTHYRQKVLIKCNSYGHLVGLNYQAVCPWYIHCCHAFLPKFKEHFHYCHAA